jgi:hypothetical protein
MAMQPTVRSKAGPGGKNRVITRLALLLLFPLCLHSGVALAQGERTQDQPRGALPALQNSLIEQPELDERTRISRREASDRARDAFPGRVLSIRLDNSHWRVRMDQEGTVFNVLVDADSGSVERARD